MTEELLQIKKKLEKKLDEKRLQHTFGVMYTAASLAMRYQENLSAAMVAGLLHDCAKYHTGEEFLEKSKKYGLPVTTAEKKNPFLLHAKLGAYYAREKYHVEDANILHAIAVHTTGCPNMNRLDKIIYIADYIEPGRTEAPRLEEIRTMSFTNLDQALIMILEDTLSYLKEKNKEMDPMTLETYEFYKKEGGSL